jgi:Ulp1 family protease
MAAPVVSGKFSRLYQSDVDLLEAGRWLNDACISWYFEQLQDSLPENVLILDPGVVQLLLFEDDEDDLRQAVEDLCLPARSLILAPVNDSEDLTAATSGSHWALAAYDCGAGTALYVDSMGGRGCWGNAQRLCGKVDLLLGKRLAPQLAAGVSEQQQNGYDCGVFTVMNAERILASRGLAVESAGSASEKRAQMRRRVDELRAA